MASSKILGEETVAGSVAASTRCQKEKRTGNDENGEEGEGQGEEGSVI